MRLIKPNNYDTNDLNIAYLGDAISHPVRKRIIEHLFVSRHNTKADFSRLLNLSEPVIGRHIQKLIDANLIEFNYSLHFERIELKIESFTELMDFLIDIGVKPSNGKSENC